MQKLWYKNWNLNKKVEAFETKGDLILDQKLVKFDVYGSLAHVQGLHKIGILSAKEIKSLKKGLHQILDLNKQGKFVLQLGDEDVHTKIENYLTFSLGEVGKKIHTGRSRNDQVLTAIRLFTKENLLEIWINALELVNFFLNFADRHFGVMIPGYTHMQKAMPSTVGIWAYSFVEGLLDDLILLKTAYVLNNQSPLGSAAGYGVPLDIDRKYVADLLGFNKVQINPLYCQNSRGKIEGTIVASLISILQDINKFSSDVMLFTTSEFGFLKVTSELCTGSSIMPQKKNVDIAELLRSKVHLLLGNYIQLVSLSSNLVSGYNRDIQDSKKPLIESLEMTVDCLKLAKILVSGIEINNQKLKKAITPEIFATYYALSLIKQGFPFREAYKKAAKEYQKIDFFQSVTKESRRLSKIENLIHDLLARQLSKESTIFEKEKNKYQTAINKLISMKGLYEK